MKKKMALSVADRLVVQTLLPEKGNFLNMKRVREMREALSFTDEEVERFKLTSNPKTGLATWDFDAEVEIEFSPEMFVLVKNKLVELSEKNELEAKHLSLYEKFAADDDELKVVK